MRPTHGEIIAYSDYLAQTAQARVDPLPGNGPRSTTALSAWRAIPRWRWAAGGAARAGLSLVIQALAPARPPRTGTRSGICTSSGQAGGVQPGASSEQRAASEMACGHAVRMRDRY